MALLFYFAEKRVLDISYVLSCMETMTIRYHMLWVLIRSASLRHSICFHGEIIKTLCGYPFLSSDIQNEAL